MISISFGSIGEDHFSQFEAIVAKGTRGRTLSMASVHYEPELLQLLATPEVVSSKSDFLDRCQFYCDSEGDYDLDVQVL